VQATLAVAEERMEGGVFKFTNAVWDELLGEDADEEVEGDRPSGAADLCVRRGAAAVSWVSRAMKEGALLSNLQLDVAAAEAGVEAAGVPAVASPLLSLAESLLRPC